MAAITSRSASWFGTFCKSGPLRLLLGAGVFLMSLGPQKRVRAQESPIQVAGLEHLDPKFVSIFPILADDYFQREIKQPKAAAAAPAHARRLFAPDAFTNPAHWQFALKTTLAVMVVYFIYTMLDWSGMRTSIVTCFFVALGSVGETVHKLTLRISGALIGGLTAGLCIVYVLPHMTDVGQLCLLIAAVSAGAAWVATGSELLSYAGLQIAFAFFLGILQGYAPATDLTVLRDRVAGIVLGNIVMTVVFTVLWPESALPRLQAALKEASEAISAVVKRTGDPGEARARTAQALVRARHFNLVRRFELSMLPKRLDRKSVV